MFRDQGEVNADVIPGLQMLHGMTRPRGGHHQRRTRGDTCADGLQNTFVGGVERPEIIATQHHQFGVVRVAKCFIERTKRRGRHSVTLLAPFPQPPLVALGFKRTCHKLVAISRVGFDM